MNRIKSLSLLMKKPIIYIAVLYFNDDLGFTYYIDMNYFIEDYTYLLNNALQEGISLVNNTFKNSSNIDLPKFKEAFDITKPTFLDLSKTTLDNTGVWDKITKNPRPLINPVPNLHLNNIPFLGVGLGVVTVFINSGLGLSERLWSGMEGVIDFFCSKLTKYGHTIYYSYKSIYNSMKSFNKKFYSNFFNIKKNFNELWNNQYINSIIKDFQKNFLIYPSSLGESVAHKTSEYTISSEIRLNQDSINTEQTFYQNLITARVRSFVGTLVNFNWNRPNDILNITTLPDKYVQRAERDDTSYDYYDILLDHYSLQESFQLRVDFGTNSLSSHFLHVGNVYNLNIYDFSDNWRALQYYITFLEIEIESMQEAHANLIRGHENIELFTFNGQEALTWNIRDFNELLDMYDDFNTQLNKKLVVLQFLNSVRSYMRSIS